MVVTYGFPNRQNNCFAGLNCPIPGSPENYLRVKTLSMSGSIQVVVTGQSCMVTKRYLGLQIYTLKEAINTVDGSKVPFGQVWYQEILLLIAES